jgi:hypothetical protein
MTMYRTLIASLGLLLALGVTPMAASATTPPPGSPEATSASPGLDLEPTATCPHEAVEELEQAIRFVRGQTWADQPGNNPLSLAPDLGSCRVVLHVGRLSDQEEAALQAGAGSRLAIEYRRDWARSSRLPLILWVVFGGSAVAWTYRRYARR